MAFCLNSSGKYKFEVFEVAMLCYGTSPGFLTTSQPSSEDLSKKGAIQGLITHIQQQSMAFRGGGMVRDCSPVQYQQLPDIAEEGIYDVAQPNVPKIIWTYWENIHQAIRTSIVTGCFGRFVGPTGRSEGGRNFQMRRIPKTFEADEEAC